MPDKPSYDEIMDRWDKLPFPTTGIQCWEIFVIEPEPDLRKRDKIDKLTKGKKKKRKSK
jgi:hypothetical protein